MRPAPGVAIEHQPEDVLLAMLLFGEARGESDVGRLGVLCVADNRRLEGGGSFTNVVLLKLQFSAFNPSDPNRSKLLTAYQTDPVGWAKCETVVALHAAGATVDPTKGATHYFAHKLVSPKWGPGHPGWTTTAIIGNHTFGIAKGA